MVLLSIFFLHESDPRRIISRLFFIHLSLHALALHLAVKYYFKSFCAEDLVRLTLHTSVGCISQNYCRTAHVTQPILSENILIFDINHQQNTRRSDQIETIKTMCKLRALVSHGRFYQWLEFAIFKEIFDQVKRSRL